jgi:hypothetical protein
VLTSATPVAVEPVLGSEGGEIMTMIQVAMLGSWRNE